MGLTPASGVIYTVKVVTDKGNIVVTKYPDQASNTIVAATAIAQSVGDIAMEFDQFKYAITSSTPLTWNTAANVTKNVNIAFKLILVNHSPKIST